MIGIERPGIGDSTTLDDRPLARDGPDGPSSALALGPSLAHAGEGPTARAARSRSGRRSPTRARARPASGRTLLNAEGPSPDRWARSSALLRESVEIAAEVEGPDHPFTRGAERLAIRPIYACGEPERARAPLERLAARIEGTQLPALRETLAAPTPTQPEQAEQAEQPE